MSRLDLVIFGATGFTGKKAVEETARLAGRHGLNWGIAGRSQGKLETLLADLSKTTGKDYSSTKIIIADVSDEQSLKTMCSQAKVVVNCCGPYRHYGEPVVRAAIDCKAHYVDVSGEPQFIETMCLEYDAQARDAGVYVVSACGFDSIPNDMGVVFLQQHFDGTLNSVESYMTVETPTEARDGSGVVHYGTWESLVYGLAHYSELGPLRKKMFPQRLPTFKPKLRPRGVLHKKQESWCVPFMGADRSIVYRTQRSLYETEHSRPVQFKPYVTIGGLFSTICAIIAGGFLFLMAKTSFTRKLLLDYPGVFSLGMVTREGPSEEVMNATKFKMELYGEGWAKGADVDTERPNKRMVAKVSGVNPGYGATVVALMLSALTILQEKDAMPGSGGVMTTGVAFRKTKLIEKLNENKLTFEIVGDK